MIQKKFGQRKTAIEKVPTQLPNVEVPLSAYIFFPNMGQQGKSKEKKLCLETPASTKFFVREFCCFGLFLTGSKWTYVKNRLPVQNTEILETFIFFSQNLNLKITQASC